MITNLTTAACSPSCQGFSQKCRGKVLSQRKEPGNTVCRQGIIEGQILINYHLWLLRYRWCGWVQATPCLCMCCPDVLPCMVALGPRLQVLIVFWSAGQVDNLHPVASVCDSADLSARLGIRSSWFITRHTVRVSWCIAIKFTKASSRIIRNVGIQPKNKSRLAVLHQGLSHLSAGLIDLYFKGIRERPLMGLPGSVIFSLYHQFIC